MFYFFIFTLLRLSYLKNSLYFDYLSLLLTHSIQKRNELVYLTLLQMMSSTEAVCSYQINMLFVVPVFYCDPWGFKCHYQESEEYHKEFWKVSNLYQSFEIATKTQWQALDICKVFRIRILNLLSPTIFARSRSSVRDTTTITMKCRNRELIIPIGRNKVIFKFQFKHRLQELSSMINNT